MVTVLQLLLVATRWERDAWRALAEERGKALDHALVLLAEASR